MPFILILAGSLLLIAAVRDKHNQLYDLLKIDFTGPNNFIYWTLAILIVGAIGYIDTLKPISDGFLILIILVLFLSKGDPNSAGGGFFQQFIAGIQTTNAYQATASGSGGTSGGTGGGITRSGVSISGGSGGPVITAGSGGVTIGGLPTRIPVGGGTIGIDFPGVITI